MFTLGPREFIVGLGSNSANGPDGAAGFLRQGRRALAAVPGWRLLRSSALYASDALLPEGAPPAWDLPFLNGACLLRSAEPLDVDAIVARLKAIERRLGREPAPRWAPRAIDLDLLDWGAPPARTAEAQVPHPGLLHRPFAFLPALDCAPASEPSAGTSATWRFADADRVPFRTRVDPRSWPETVAILNLTPDSFSGGSLADPLDAIEAAVRAQVGAGAAVIDVGAESTRPRATPVPPEEEWRRLQLFWPTLLRLRQELGFKLSLDSRHPGTVARALEAGPLDWINDVEGLRDPRMAEIAAQCPCSLVFMHALGVPPRPDVTLPLEADPMAAVSRWAQERVETLAGRGIVPDRLILDPGIGFGKTAAQNLEILNRADELALPGVRLLIGHSRKRFLDPESRIPAADRDLETAIASARLARSSVDYLRVHSASAAARALALGARLG